MIQELEGNVSWTRALSQHRFFGIRTSFRRRGHDFLIVFLATQESIKTRLSMLFTKYL